MPKIIKADVIRIVSTLNKDKTRFIAIEELQDKGMPKVLCKILYNHRATTSHQVDFGYPKKQQKKKLSLKNFINNKKYPIDHLNLNDPAVRNLLHLRFLRGNK